MTVGGGGGRREEREGRRGEHAVGQACCLGNRQWLGLLCNGRNRKAPNWMLN